MKRISIFLIALTSTTLVSAQSTLSFGARGGLDFLMPRSNLFTNSKVGGAGAFDLGYTYYWNTRNSGDWGIHTGISAGYATNGAQVNFNHQFTNYDYMNNEMLYTVSGSAEISLQRVFVEVPLMTALRTNGFFLQLGLKAQFSAWSRASQSLKNPSIDAFYVPFDVHVTDELITGLVAPADMQKTFKNSAPFVNLLVATRIGYEFEVGNNGKLGIAAYLDYNAWNNYADTRNKPLISVAPISDPAKPVPEVTVNDAFASVISGIHPLQVGLTVYYTIELGGSRQGFGNRNGYKAQNNYKRNRGYKPANRYRRYRR